LANPSDSYAGAVLSIGIVALFIAAAFAIIGSVR